MDDMTAFERQLGTVLDHMGGPEPGFDAMAIASQAARAAPVGRWSVVSRRLGVGRAPASAEGSFSMFSALKFVAAVAVVALFGGFLVAGLLATPQGDEKAPAITPSDELSFPGGAAIIAGLDGSIWLGEGDRMVRLGEEGSVEVTFGDSGSGWGAEKEVVAADSTMWVVRDAPDSDNGRSGLFSYDGEKWDEHETPPPMGLAAAPDGAIWVTWGGTDSRLARFDAGGHSVIGMPAALRQAPDEHRRLAVTDDGDVWAWGDEAPLHRYDGETWQEVEMPCGGTAVGRDGTVWCTQRRWTGNVFDQPATALYRLDGAGLQRLAVDDDSLAALMVLIQTKVTPDGRLWVSGDPRGDGVDLFDGDSRTHYLQGHAVYGWDMAPDGSVWVLAAKTDVDDSPIHIYVITPEAVAATE